MEARVPADGHDLLAGLVLDHSCPSLLGIGQGCHSALNRIDVVRVSLRVACNGDREIVAEVLPDELHQVEGAVEASLRGRPLLLAARGIASEGHDVPDSELLALLQRVLRHLGALVRASQVHVGHAAKLVLGGRGELQGQL